MPTAPDAVALFRSQLEALREPTVKPAFDAYVIVDWSARSTPATGKDSIWWVEFRWPSRRGAPPSLEVGNPETRDAAFGELLARLTGPLGGARVLVGFDFPLGYPSGLAKALGHRGPDAWRRVWDRLVRDIDDDARNVNNRLVVAAALNAELTGGAGPFYGRPANAAAEIARYLPATRRGSFEYPVRTLGGISLTRERLVDRGARTASSPWFVYGGANSVGGQALVGIPRVARLRAKLPDGRVWPFETGATLPPRSEARVVLAEIYPSMFHRRLESADVHDRLQVIATALALAKLDGEGTLSEAFNAPAQHPASIREEGWILGVP